MNFGKPVINFTASLVLVEEEVYFCREIVLLGKIDELIAGFCEI